MRKEDSSISVKELIDRYHRELMEFQKQHADTTAAAKPAQGDSCLDGEFPLPDVEQDLQNLRNEQEAFMAAVPPDVQEPAAESVATMATPAPALTPEEEDARAAALENPPDMDGEILSPRAVSPAQPQQGVPAFPTDASSPAEALAPPPPMDMSLGYLKVSTTTGRGALPVRGALVTVTRMEDGVERLEQVRTTDESGSTPLFTLPAVSAVYSMTPGAEKPFTYYTVHIRSDGYYPVRLVNVPLYGGVTSIQAVDLIPVAEGGDKNQTETIVDGAPENLQ